MNEALLSGAILSLIVSTSCLPVAARAEDTTSAASDKSGVVGEVIVSARRVAEDLQKVPVADTVVSNADLKRQDIQDYNDLARTVPSMTSFGPYRDNFTVAIRGQGGGDASGAGGAAVETYFDEVPLPRNRNGGAGGGGPGSFFDMDAIEVLKGPQGTLFGRNSTGGAVLFTTKKPTNAFEGYVEGGVGNYNDRQIGAVVNIPIVDEKLLVRIAGMGRDQDGFTHVDSLPGFPNGKWLDSVSYDVGRISVAIEPTAQLRNDIVVDADNSNNSAPSNILTYVAPGSLAATLYPGIFQVLAQQKQLGPRDQAALSTNQSSHKYTLTALDALQYNFTSNLSLRNLFSYSHEANSQAIDADGTVYPVFASQKVNVPYYNNLFTEELQARGRVFADRLDWSAGIYADRNPLPPYTNSLYVALGGPSITSVSNGGHTEAIYGQASYAITDRLKATVGVRQTWNYLEGRTRAGLDPATGTCTTPTALTDSNCVIARNASFSAVTWTLGLDYQLAQDTMIYVASRRGFRDGGFNTTVSDPSLFAYAPEFVTDQEVGVKTTYQLFGDVTARINADIYHQDYSAVQATLGALSDGALILYTGNGGDAKIWGSEFEGWLYPTRDVELSANFDYLDFAYTHLDQSANAAAILALQSNGRPRWKYGFGGRYHVPLDGKFGSVSFTANWNWTGQNGDNSLPFGMRPAYGLLNLSADWDNVAGKPIDLSFVVTNALDKTYEIGGYVLEEVGTTTTTYGEPRMFGVRLRYNFH